MSEPREPPLRPAIPVTLYALFGAGFSARFALWYKPAWSTVIGAAALCLAVAALSYILTRRHAHASLGGALMMVAGVCVVALCVGKIGLSVRESAAAEMVETTISKLSFEAQGDSSSTQRGYRTRCGARLPSGRPATIWLTTKEPLMLGDAIRCVGRFTPNDESDWGRQSAAQGIVGTVHATHVAERGTTPSLILGSVREHRKKVVADLIATDTDGGAVVAGAVCGYQLAARDRSLPDLFSTCGVSHLMAVSGSHLATVSMLASVVLARSRIRVRARSLILLALGLLFVMFCGAPPSAVRSWIMCLAAQGALIVGRRSYGLSSVCLVALCMGLFDPTLFSQLGFLLSVSSVVALCLYASYGHYVMTQTFGHPWTALGRYRLGSAALSFYEQCVSMLSASIVAQVASIPLIVPIFGQLSLVGPLAGVVLALPFALVLMLGVVGAALRSAGIGGTFLSLASLCGDGVVGVLRFAAKVPFASMPVTDGSLLSACVLVLLACILVLWPRVRPLVVRAALILALALCGIWIVHGRYFAPARICVLDVGQADSILVQEGAHAILVDTGEDGSALAQLKLLGVSHLDLVVLTHLHADHVGGLDELIAGMHCERVAVAQGVSSNMDSRMLEDIRRHTKGNPLELSQDDSVAFGEVRMTVIGPAGCVTGNKNEDSLVMDVVIGRDKGLHALLTGDAERKELSSALDHASTGPIDLLKVGHHGSEVSIDEEEARKLRPLISVASAGEGNSYGHPTARCKSILESAGSRFLCTIDCGTIQVLPDRRGLKVLTTHQQKWLQDVA